MRSRNLLRCLMLLVIGLTAALAQASERPARGAALGSAFEAKQPARLSSAGEEPDRANLGSIFGKTTSTCGSWDICCTETQSGATFCCMWVANHWVGCAPLNPTGPN